MAVGESVSTQRLSLYADDLCDIPQEILATAFVKVRREWEYSKLPPVGYIRKACGQQFDGRPGPEEAWSRMPKGERMELDTVVWCEEEREAFEVCRSLLANGDLIAARMCFLEKYRAELEQSRIRGRALVWSVSCGYDQTDRVMKIADAVKHKRLPASIANAWIPIDRMNEFLALLPPSETKGLLPTGTLEPVKELPGFYGLLHKMRVEKTLPDGCEPGEKTPERTPLTKEELGERKKVLRKQAEQVTAKYSNSESA